jgi:hypothetical protein
MVFFMQQGIAPFAAHGCLRGTRWKDHSLAATLAGENCYAHVDVRSRFVVRMKTIASLALLACALFVSACSHDEPATTSNYGTSHSTTTTGYSK